MNRDEYRRAISPLLDQAHELHMAIWALMQTMPGDASKTAEYSDLALAMDSVSQAADVFYRARYPRPSGLTESVPVDVSAPHTPGDTPMIGIGHRPQDRRLTP